MERSLVSIRNGAAEVSSQWGEHTACAALETSIRADLPRVRVDGTACAVMDLMPRLLHLFHIVVHDSVAPSGGLDFSAPQTEERAANFEQTKKLADSTSALMAGRGLDAEVYVSAIYSSDWVILDPEDYALYGVVAARDRETNGRVLRILSRTLFRQLYASMPWGPYAFVRLPGREVLTARGQYTHDQLLIQVYSTLPQLRVIAHAQDTEKYAMYRDKVSDLIRCCAARRGVDPGGAPEHGDPGGAGREAGGYGNFAMLNRLAHMLTAELARHLGPRDGENPVSRNSGQAPPGADTKAPPSVGPDETAANRHVPQL